MWYSNIKLGTERGDDVEDDFIKMSVYSYYIVGGDWNMSDTGHLHVTNILLSKTTGEVMFNESFNLKSISIN